MHIYGYEKYLTTPEKLKSKVEEYGVAIIPSVLNNNEIKAMNDGMWHTLEHITKNFETPMKRNKKDTYKEIYKLFPNHSMLIQHYSIGHAQFIWDIRQNNKICDVFSKFWNVEKEDLICSFDAASWHMPHEITNRGFFRKSWLHTDQSFKDSDFKCLQSWVTGYDVNPGDATLTFLEKSHKYHKEFNDVFKITDRDKQIAKKDWFKLENEEQHKFFKEKECNKYSIKCKAGDLVCWDSRTMHCGQEPLKKRDKANFRNVAYICMTPRSFAHNKILDKRIKAFEEMRMTTHWPHKAILFGKAPRTYGEPLPNVEQLPPPEINSLGRNLVGY